MAAGTFTLYDHLAEGLGNKEFNFDTDTIKMTLHTSAYTPSAAHAVAADLTNEVANANGYTTGGITLTTPTWAQAAGVAKFSSDPAVWTAAGGSLTARYAVLRDTTIDHLIGYMLLDATPANVVATDGNTLTVGPHATNGWFQFQSNA